LLVQRPSGLIGWDDMFEEARREESEAIVEFTRVLKIFTELTVNGKMPPGPPVAAADGGGR
jgi:hypothetical protein